ncbi:MAG TPA: type II toxin-antitoxin system VapC family toxin [Pirellulales bacterium]
MNFGDLVRGESVFIDANTLVYHFTVHPSFGAACTDLIRRVNLGEIRGLISAHAISETAHRLMTIEAVAMNGWPHKGIAQRLKKHPDHIQALTHFRQAVASIPKLGIQTLPVEITDIENATAVSQQFGLLSGDALVVAIMQSRNVVNLASYDADFDRIPWLRRFDSR